MSGSRKPLLAILEGSRRLLDWAAQLVSIVAEAPQMCPPTANTARELEQWNRFRQECDAILQPKGGLLTTSVDDEVARRIVQQVREAEPELGEFVVAHELLFSLDATLGPGLMRACEPEGTLELRPGDVFPICAHDPRWILGPDVALCSMPSRTEMGLRRLAHLGVLPTIGIDYRVTFDFRFPALFTPFITRPVVALLFPNAEPFDAAFTTHVDGGIGRFFDVRPRDEEKQKGRILALLEDAQRRGATLAMLPELSTTPGIVTAINDWLSKPGRPAMTVVAGSHHLQDAEGAHNRSVILGPGATGPLHHDKFNAYDHRIGAAMIREDLRPAEMHLRLFVSEGMTFCVLICKDLLAEQARHVLGALRPNVVLVPAFTDDTSSFDLASAALAQSGQTITLVCNYAGPDPRKAPKSTTAAPSCALAVLPVGGDGHTIRYPAPFLGNPSTVLMNLHAPSLGWRAYEPSSG